MGDAEIKDWVEFDALKKAVSLEAVLRWYQVPGLRRRRHQLQGRCPIHRGKRDDSFRASLAQSAFHCFACQASGNVLDFVAAIRLRTDVERCSIREAALKLQQWFGIARPEGLHLVSPDSVADRARGVQLVRKKEGNNPTLRFALRRVDPGHPYLAERGIKRATAVEFGVGFYAGPGLMSGRIVIPIRNASGELVAYAGRALDGTPPKYKLPVGFRKGLELFNLHRAASTASKTVIVVEGYFGCLRVHQAGLRCVVALMGSSLSTEQKRILMERFDRVVLMLDGDAAGRAASRVIGSQLASRSGVVAVNLPDGAQPDQLPPAVMRSLLFEATQEINIV